MYKYNDGLLNGSRTPRLYLVRGDEAKKFTGENIPGFTAIVTAVFDKNGKWSNTTYELDLAPGVRPLYFASPLHGTWGDNLPSWGAVAEKLQLPIEVAQGIIRLEYPGTAKRLDALETFAAENEAVSRNTEAVTISFGSPTNRMISDGWWDEPKSGHTADGRIVTVRPGQGGWCKAEVVEPEGAKIIDVQRTPGMHGGYYAVHVAVPV